MKHTRFKSLAECLESGEHTQETLAEAARCSQSAVSLALNFGRGSYSLLKRLAEAGDFPLDSFRREDAA